MSGTVLVLGASGRFGRHAAEAFWNRGWRVKTFDRSTDDLVDAARDVDVIVNGWNPPYPAWEREVPKLTEQVIAAARASDATVILPGNVYVFGADAPECFDEETPHLAKNPLGRVRIEMEDTYRRSGVQTVILRGGDFIDTEASGNWFDAVITSKINKGGFVAPGSHDAIHAWAYLPDMARASVLLAEKRRELEQFEDIPFSGLTLSLEELRQLCEAEAVRPLKMRSFPWLAIHLAGLVWPMGRHLAEMRYLWSKPHYIDGTRFDAILPDFQMTQADEAISIALKSQIDPYKPMPRSSAHVAAE